LSQNGLFSDFMHKYDEHRQVETSLEDYLIGCRKDPLTYASAAERLLAAIGQPRWSIPATTSGSGGSS